jgi:hypothetical protein
MEKRQIEDTEKSNQERKENEDSIEKPLKRISYFERYISLENWNFIISLLAYRMTISVI